ncbi:MAG TPA: APC family permease [Pseudomonadales bacterium]
MTPVSLRRELGLAGAVLLGLGSILGTGVFVSLGIAAGIAGGGVVPALVLAAGLASCNALSSARLAAAYPVSGGTYEYGHALLNPSLGFAAGWLFLCAKIASAATAAIGVVGYACRLVGVEPGGWLGPLAAAVALGTTLLVLGGLRRSSAANAAIVGVTLLALGAFAVAGLVLRPGGAGATSRGIAALHPDAAGAFFHATALMFVAYTGYARIATLGEEVRAPARTIPRAIVLTLIVSAALYVLVALAALGAVDGTVLAAAAASGAVPLEAAAAALGLPGLTELVALGAVTAMLGVLLNLLLGLSRVALAMGRRGDLPPRLARVSGRGSPSIAVVAVGTIVALVAAFGAVELTWSFSALTVLIYYGITNAAALRLPGARDGRWVPWAGLGGCAFLILFLPPGVWLLGGALIGVGFAWRRLAQRLWRGSAAAAGPDPSSAPRRIEG